MLNSTEITKELEPIIKGEVLSEEWQQNIYATDASIYEILPTCIVIPKDENDVIKTVRYAYNNNIPITARGGGTSLAGQSIGKGIIIDFSKYLNKIIKFSNKNNYIVVEPGIYKSEIDLFLKKYNKFFPPDPSSSEFCTIGGMISNNSGGSHTVKYGSTFNYLLSLKVVLSNGDVIETEQIKIGEKKWIKKISKNNFESSVYINTLEIIDNNIDIIKGKERKIKNSSGYKLGSIINRKKKLIDLTKLFVSSEGTLGIILQAKLKVIPIPRYFRTVMLQFNSFNKLGLTIYQILKTSPSAVELLDHYVISQAYKIIPELKNKLQKNVKALILIEYDGKSYSEVYKKMEKLKKNIHKSKSVYKAKFAYSIKDSEELWKIRKKSLPYSMKIRKNGKKPTPFIEDIVIPPKKLSALIKKLYNLYKKYHVKGVIYGHAGDGQLHTRPIIDLRNVNDIKLMKEMADEVYEFVIKNKGSITGEHGDGILRSEYLIKMFGEDLYLIFLKIKQIFDPKKILNPNVKISNKHNNMTENLRYISYIKKANNNVLNWKIESDIFKKIIGYKNELDYKEEIDLCHSCGNCREITPGRMCPVYKAYRNEINSCRGRISLLRWLLKKDFPNEIISNIDNYHNIIYDNCIQCKMCYVECPSNVNVGKLMEEARSKYLMYNKIPRGYKFFVNLDTFLEIGYKLNPISNYLINNKIFRYIFEKITYIDKERRLPKFNNKSFLKEYNKYIVGRKVSKNKKKVAFFYDSYIKYYNPTIGILIVKILEKNGFNVIIPSQRSSGLPAVLEGSNNIAKKIIEYNINILAPLVKKGIPIITFSPSSGLALKLEYLNIVNNENSRAVSNLTYNIHEFLYLLHKEGKLYENFKTINKDVYLHIHCHDIVQRIDNNIISLLKLLPGLKFEVIEKGCCGIGGSFGFIKDNYKRSRNIGKPLFDFIDKSDKPVYSTGESCSMQINEMTNKKIGLTIELISEAYNFIN